LSFNTIKIIVLSIYFVVVVVGVVVVLLLFFVVVVPDVIYYLDRKQELFSLIVDLGLHLSDLDLV